MPCRQPTVPKPTQRARRGSPIFGLERLESRAVPVAGSLVAGTDYVANVLMASFRAPRQPELLSGLIADLDQRLGDSISGSRTILSLGEGADATTLVRLNLAPGTNVLAAVQTAEQASFIAWAAPDFLYPESAGGSEYVPNDPNYPNQYHLPQIEAPPAWDQVAGATPLVVAIADTGIAYDHEDLAANMWTNPNEIAGNGLDDDHNGYIDDVRGWDFGDHDNDPYPFTFQYNGQTVGDVHGTAVAGIIGSVTNNGIGVAGSANNLAKIMNLRIGLDAAVWSSSTYAEAYAYAVDNGAKIIETSRFIDDNALDPVFVAGLDYVYQHGVLQFNSASNGSLFNTARQFLDEFLLVANLTETGAKNPTSNYGDGIDISAPGTNIWTAGLGNRYEVYTGASMATPSAVGTAALIWAKHPTWTRDQVAAQLLGTTVNIDAQNPQYIGYLGTGRVDALQALSMALPPPKFTKVLGLPPIGGATSTAPTEISLRLSGVLDRASVLNTANYELKGAGLDETFGTADDFLAPLTLTTNYMIGSNFLKFSVGSLSPGKYQLRVHSGGITDPFGTALDGNGDGTSGDDFHTEFIYDPVPAGVLGPDAFGYVAQAVAPTFTDISTTGAVIGNSGDDVIVTLNDAALPGFAFPFYGTTYSSVSISSNGLITFGAGNSSHSNTDLTTAPATPAIAVLWDDLELAAGGLRARLDGSGNNQRLIVQWNNIHYLDNPADPITFQVILNESDGSIEINYQDLDSAGSPATGGQSATVGIKETGNQSGTGQSFRLLVGYNDATSSFIGTNQSLRIFANTRPTANAGGSYAVHVGEPLTLNATGTDPDVGQTLAYSWDLNGDGNYTDAIGPSPTLSWNELTALGIGPGLGDHSIHLKVFDGIATTTAAATLSVLNTPPSANPGGPYTVPLGGILMLDGSQSADPDIGQSLSYSWDINGDGIFTDALGVAPTLSWSQLLSLGIGVGLGDRTIYLRVSDGTATTTATGLLSVLYAAPTANAGGPYSIIEGQSLSLDASGSWAPEGTALDFEWDVNDDGVFGDATGVYANLSWAQLIALGLGDNGTHSVRVRIADGYTLTTSDPAALEIQNRGPSAALLAAPTDTAGRFTFALLATDQSPTDQSAGYTFLIDWNGDGVTDEATSGLAGTLVTHDFASAANVRVTATDKDGSASVPIFLAVDPARADLSFTGTGDVDSIQLQQTGPTSVRTSFTVLGGVAYSWFIDSDHVTGEFRANAGAGDDILSASGLSTIAANMLGGAGNDTLYGGGAADTLTGDAPGLSLSQLGADDIHGGGGDDTILGDADGGEGKGDHLAGDDGNDVITADGAEGSITASDNIDGGDGNDKIVADGAEGAVDAITGDDGDDYINTGNGNDTAHGGAGNDILFGGDGGEGSSDTLTGDAGNDILIGGVGADSLAGGTGQDLLIAGAYSVGNPNAIFAIQAEWLSANAYSDKTANLTGTGVGVRANGDNFLQAGVNVLNDQDIDTVLGEDDTDFLFLAVPVDVSDSVAGETVVNLA